MIFFVVDHELEVVVITLAESCRYEVAEGEFADCPFVENILEMLKLAKPKKSASAIIGGIHAS